MQVSNSDIFMAARYSHTRIDTFRERLEIWKDPPSRQNSESQASTSEDVSKTEDKVSLSNVDPKYLIIKLLLEKLTGKKIRIVEVSELEGADSESLNKLSDAAAASSGNGRVGWGVRYDSSETHQESQEVQFNARGVIKTKDGKNIKFDLHVMLKSNYLSEQNFSFRAGDAKKVDPLVINFNGAASELTDMKFEFDLDADDNKDTISFVTPGSGFLALDKNGDGKINDGSELFGPVTGNGFEELSAYDKDGNSWIDEGDEIYGKLLVWMKDAEGNDRLVNLKEQDIGALYLGNLESKFDIKNSENQTQGEVKRFGIYLTESNPTAGVIQQIDLVV